MRTRQAPRIHASGAGFQGYVLGASAQVIRAAPTLSAKRVGELPPAAAVVIVCTETGTPVSGPRRGGGTLTERLWDRVHATGSTGFVPDVWVKTGTTGAVAPACR